MRFLRHRLPLLFGLASAMPMISTGSQAFLEQEFVLTPQQVKSLSSDALDGSGHAALRLSRFYSNVVVNLDEAMIGAEDGDANCQYTAYIFLDRRMSPEDRRRALFWLKKAADQGYQPAIGRIRDGR